MTKEVCLVIEALAAELTQRMSLRSILTLVKVCFIALLCVAPLLAWEGLTVLDAQPTHEQFMFRIHVCFERLNIALQRIAYFTATLPQRLDVFLEMR